ncbi:universal stress protein [Amnibacterium kyonggiense]|uniref:Nucleotide-binding universal stress UspA family protein n=1 Tax=Amnibacterium kyonggiense TaxID=595671 RepID=A0A4R7FKG0_9MICO|nr:universal stress protein [Amnibacterium kyonggiense]TDS76836.1 nucleotide-binding universal stress UspA family protein [Amnibacterium kyonggiense]
MYESVVIGWDGSPASEEALRWASRRPLGDRYRLLHVVDDRRAREDDASPLDLEAAADRALQARVAQAALDAPFLRVIGEIAVGHRKDELERRTGRSAVLVLGSDRSPGVVDRLRWNVATRIASRAHGPVIVVPPGAADRRGPVVAGVDGTSAARAAALRAAEFAEATSAPLVLLHAWQAVGEPDVPPEPPEDDGIGVDREVPGEDVPSRTVEHAHAAVLDAVLQEVRAAHPTLRVTGRLVHESAPVALREAAADAGLLVLGRHGRWSSSAVLLGSITHAMLLAGVAPLLVVGRQDVPVPVPPLPAPAEVEGSSRQVIG